jgi:hypothetical protein
MVVDGTSPADRKVVSLASISSCRDGNVVDKLIFDP